MKALGLRPRAFICFSVFGTRDKHLPSFLTYDLKSAEGVVHRRNSSFVTPYNISEEPENPGRAEALTSPVISPLSVTTSETTEPRRRPNRTMKMPAKFKDFVLEK